MDTSYLKLIAGSRVSSHMGLKVDNGHQYKFGKNYLHIDVPALGVQDAEAGTTSLEVKRNQHVFVAAAGIVDVKGRSFIIVEPNAALAEFGQVQGMYILHPDSGPQRLGMWFTARKDTDLSKLEYAVRLYMPA